MEALVQPLPPVSALVMQFFLSRYYLAFLFYHLTANLLEIVHLFLHINDQTSISMATISCEPPGPFFYFGLSNS
jgi:hypothetical protein